MSFLRHREIYPSDGGAGVAASAPAHRLDEFPAGYSLAGWSPPEPASASLAGHQYAVMSSCRFMDFQRSANSVLTGCLTPGGKRTISRPSLPKSFDYRTVIGWLRHARAVQFRHSLQGGVATLAASNRAFRFLGLSTVGATGSLSPAVGRFTAARSAAEHVLEFWIALKRWRRIALRSRAPRLVRFQTLQTQTPERGAAMPTAWFFVGSALPRASSSVHPSRLIGRFRLRFAPFCRSAALIWSMNSTSPRHSWQTSRCSSTGAACSASTLAIAYSSNASLGTCIPDISTSAFGVSDA